MASDLNRVMLIGRLTRDPEMKSTNTGTFFCRFTLANNRSYYRKEGDLKEEVGFFDCLAWGKQAEVIGKYLTKGKRIAVEGTLRFSSWENSEGKKQSKVEIQIENFQFLDGKSEGSQQSSGGSEAYGSNAPAMGATIHDDPFGSHGSSVISDDDIPF